MISAVASRSQNNKQKKQKRIIIGAVAILLLILISLSIWYFSSSTSGTTAASSGTKAASPDTTAASSGTKAASSGTKPVTPVPGKAVPVCDDNSNFVLGKPYGQIHVGDHITETEAFQKCSEESDGRDFFYQSHTNGHTICGFFEDKLTPNDTRVKHGHKFGSVCKY